jgi:hypothetical protein
LAGRYAPALLLEVFAFWFILRWFLAGWLVLFFRHALIVLMLVGVLGTIDEHRFVWTACFAGSALLAWLLLRRWRARPDIERRRFRVSISLAWHGTSADEVAMLCERRIGLKVDAASPATVTAKPPTPCVLALAGDGIWVLEDESGMRHAAVGRVMACWDRTRLVAHVEHSRRRERFELSWPGAGALVRGVMPPGPPATQFAGVLVADELTRS